MNCAYHADQSAVAYCRTCGKALCANCTRPVRGVIYCEDCLGAKMGVGAPAASFVPPAGAVVPPPGAVPPTPPYVPPASTSGPNPTVAGILAGVFPFGVGAVYTGQYAKGLAHLAIFALLIAGCNANGEVIPAISGIGIAFFIVYQIIDAVRSARAIQAGLPPPDPYGLGATFGGGVRSDAARLDASKADAGKIPTGAIVLILLGVLFLLHTAGVFEVGFERIWPVFLMGLGVWLFVRNYGLMGTSCCDPVTHRRRIMGPAMLFTVGALWFLDTFDRVNLSFNRTWPVILLVIG
ncbi:MAG: LiaI-LiaF-like domain-containing protein, partial [Terriglobales bacterium]